MQTRGRVLVEAKRVRALKLEFSDHVLGTNSSLHITATTDFSAAVASTSNDRGLQIQGHPELKTHEGDLSICRFKTNSRFYFKEFLYLYIIIC